MRLKQRIERLEKQVETLNKQNACHHVWKFDISIFCHYYKKCEKCNLKIHLNYSEWREEKIKQCKNEMACLQKTIDHFKKVDNDDLPPQSHDEEIHGSDKEVNNETNI